MIRNSLKHEYDLEFLMETENGNSFVGWKLVIGKNIIPDLYGKYWFNPMTSKVEIAKCAYLANHMDDGDYGKPYEASLLWKIYDLDVEKFKPVKFSEDYYAKCRQQFSKIWKECWKNMETSYNNYKKSKYIPVDSMFTNHFLYLDNLFEEKNPFIGD